MSEANMKKKIKMADIVRPTKEAAKEKEIKRKGEKEIKALEKKIERFEKEEVDIFGKEEARRRKKLFIKKPKLKTFLWMFALLILIGGGIYAAIVFLPRAEIKIITEKSDWKYNDSIIASKKVSDIDLAGKKIPAEVFSQKKNNNLLFPATGTKEVRQRATGKITVYNAYSSDSQPLIANTRFLAPDGKIFRLTAKIIVPGAKIVEGKIIPSGVEAEVAADNPGEEYNIGSVEYFSIPGFKGSAKEQGFYAESKSPFSGGFIGKVAVPTDEDIKKAKEKNKQILQQALVSFVKSQIPNNFKIIDGAERFNMSKESVNQKTDEAGNFLVFSEDELLVVAFQEIDVKNLIQELAKKDLGMGFEPKEYQLDYGVSRTDFDNGQISFPVNFQGIFWQPLNIGEFQETAKNKKESELRAMVFTLPGVEKVTVSFWPFWVKQVPDKVERIKVIID